jgi:hypothetical protein
VRFAGSRGLTPRCKVRGFAAAGARPFGLAAVFYSTPRRPPNGGLPAAAEGSEPANYCVVSDDAAAGAYISLMYCFSIRRAE